MEKLALLVALLVLAPACAARNRPPESGGGDGPKYPPRPARCQLTVTETPTPGVPAWDDLGVAEVACHINTGQPECLSRLRAEACRLGGDLLYNVPKRPLRPRDEVMLFRGQVAHTVDKKRGGAKAGAPATESAPAGPIQPLPHAATPDGGG